MDNNTHEVLSAIAPYLATIIAAVVSYLSFRESKRKTKHDELSDLYDKVSEDNARLREENEKLMDEIIKLKEGKIHED